MACVAITGATGFIGAAVAQYLAADGWAVRALCRAPAHTASLQRLGAEIVPGDLADRSALRRLLADADAIVHCAGAVRGATYRDFAAVNVDGTAALLQVAGSAPPPFVVLSSLAAREPTLSHYARSKRAMEDLLDRPGPPSQRLVLRPPPVYGPGDRELMPLFGAMARGWAPLPGPPTARLSLLYVSDLAAAIATWLQQTDAGAGVYEIHDGRPDGYSWDDVIAVAEQVFARRIHRLRVPAPPLQAVSRFNARLGQAFGYAPMFTPGKLRELRHRDWVCDDAPLRRVLDWQPRVALLEGLRRTWDWVPGQAA